jgi:hypothetical protein
MAREISVLIWCDPCMEHGVREPAVDELTITIVGVMQSKARTLAVCEPHRKEYVDPLVEQLTRNSSLPDAQPRQVKKHAVAERGAQPAGEDGTQAALRGGGGHFCPVCQHELSTDAGVRGHCIREHGKSLQQIQGIPTPYACRAEGCTVAFTRPNARTMHETRTHGLAVPA